MNGCRAEGAGAHLDHWPLHLSLCFRQGVGVAVDVAARTSLLHEIAVVRAGEEADVVDQGDSRREQLQSAREQVPLLILLQRGEVRHVQLHNISCLYRQCLPLWLRTDSTDISAMVYLPHPQEVRGQRGTAGRPGSADLPRHARTSLPVLLCCSYRQGNRGEGGRGRAGGLRGG